MAYTLQLLHTSDLEGGVDAIADAPNFAVVVDALEAEFAESTLIVSAGDNYIPGPFFNAASDFSLDGAVEAANQAIFDEAGLTNIRTASGRVDIAIMNAIGFDASAIGNHEFDAGSDAFETIIEEDVRGATLDDIRHLGAQFPYLSSNLDFTNDSDLSNIFTTEILDSSAFELTPDQALAGGNPPKIAQGTIVTLDDGEQVGVVGATTQLVNSISTPSGTVDATGGQNDMTALAAAIQPVVDEIVATGVDKVVIISHLQQFALEQELATLLVGVDVIVAGGSDTIVADTDDRLRSGDEIDVEGYPFVATSADGKPVAIVSTDGEYSYVGRLVVEFDENGEIIVDSISDEQSGAFATDEEGVLAVTGAATVEDAIAASESATIVADLTEAVEAIVIAADGNTFGETAVFIEGRREFVRTEETTMGNLTADANLVAAQSIDDAVLVSLKNGGGIRGAIGEVDGDTGELLPTQENPLSGKEEGQISQLDTENTLRFNNSLVLVTLSAEDLLAILEHAVSASDDGATPGQFPQVGGVRFSFDVDQPAGSRVETVAVFGEDGPIEIVAGGEVVDGAPTEIRAVTLNFLAEGGDGYPYPELGEDFQLLTVDGDGAVSAVDAVFDEGGDLVPATDLAEGVEILGEQQALQQFLATTFPADDDPSTATFIAQENAAEDDNRIVQDAPVEQGGSVKLSAIMTLDGGAGDGGAEIVSYEDGLAYVTNGANDSIDVFDVATGETAGSIDLSTLDGFDGVNSVSVKDGLIAVAIEGDGAANGFVAIYSVDDLSAPIATAEAGNLPDMVTFTPDGTKILVANEGEPISATVNPEGSVSIIALDEARTGVASITTVGFPTDEASADALREEGVRIFPGFTAAEDFEPEFITVTPDGSTAYVSLQENNAFAIIDLATDTLTDIVSQGSIDVSEAGNGFDVSNEDGAINITSWPVQAFRMADAITSVEIDGQTYVLSANEGDAREYTVEEEGPAFEGGEILDLDRAGDLTLNPENFDNIETLQRDENLGRLEVSTIDGDADGDGVFEELYAFGSRSFTIFDTDGNVVYDSGDLFARIAAEFNTAGFGGDFDLGDDDQVGGGDDEIGFDNRSDDAGAEPESVTVGVVGGRTFAFVGLERDGGIVVMDISNPERPDFVQYINSTADGNVSPEGLAFVAAADSPTGSALLLASYELSGTTVAYEIDDSGFGLIEADNGGDAVEGTLFSETILGGNGDDFIEGRAGNDEIIGRRGDDVIKGNFGNDELRGKAGDDVISGNAGVDFIFGGGGDDVLGGGRGDDTLVGNGGADTLTGGGGDDVLTGGLGTDAFVFDGAFGDDAITDFTSGEDTLRFVGLEAGDVTVTTDGVNTLVSTESGTVTLLGVASIDEANDIEFLIEG